MRNTQTVSVVMEVRDRRFKQDDEHGGPAHDDEVHPDIAFWFNLLNDYKAKASACFHAGNYERYRGYMLDVAAISVAMIEQEDRRAAARITETARG